MICHSAWALGVGRRMLDELLKLIEAKSGRAGSLGDNQAFQGEYAMAEGEVPRGTRARLRDLERRPGHAAPRRLAVCAAEHAHPPGAPARHLDGRGGVHVRLHGGRDDALRSGVIQRFFRDMHAGTQHMTSSPPVRQACGRMLAGLAPGKRWAFVSLVDEA